jgi:hypothetical protein
MDSRELTFAGVSDGVQRPGFFFGEPFSETRAGLFEIGDGGQSDGFLVRERPAIRRFPL